MRVPSLVVRFGILLLVAQTAFSQIKGNSVSPAVPPQPGQMGKPLSLEDKFRYRVTGAFGPRSFLFAAATSGIAHGLDIPERWGQDGAGYGQRFASAYGSSFARQTFAFTLESITHQDPRYLPSGKTGFKARFLHALQSGYRTKGDNGEWQFAYSRYASAFGSGFLANTWQPKGNNAPSDAVLRGVYILLGDLGYNVVQEFVPWTRPRVGRYP